MATDPALLLEPREAGLSGFRYLALDMGLNDDLLELVEGGRRLDAVEFARACLQGSSSEFLRYVAELLAGPPKRAGKGRPPWLDSQRRLDEIEGVQRRLRSTGSSFLFVVAELLGKPPKRKRPGQPQTLPKDWRKIGWRDAELQQDQHYAATTARYSKLAEEFKLSERTIRKAVDHFARRLFESAERERESAERELRRP